MDSKEKDSNKDVIGKEFRTREISDLMNFQFAEYKEMENDELSLKLAGALPVNMEKGFVPRYVFDIVVKAENLKVGFLTLRAALTKNLLLRGGHIGYEIEAPYRGHGYAAKSIILLKPFIKSVIGRKILITCDNDNIASRKTIEKTGAKIVKIETIEVPGENCAKNCCYYMLELF